MADEADVHLLAIDIRNFFIKMLKKHEIIV